MTPAYLCNLRLRFLELLSDTPLCECVPYAGKTSGHQQPLSPALDALCDADPVR